MPDNKLIIFVKNPVKGKVKTRLAKSVGDTRALEIYLKLIEYTRDQVVGVSGEKEISYSQEIVRQDEWDEDIFFKSKQEGDTLGERMKNAFFKGLIDQDFMKVVLIGSDCAELTTNMIGKSFEALDKTDVVIGPAEDGGYYLIGMRRFIPQLFEDINWSTSEVFKHTVEKVQENDASFSTLEILSDVDEIGDWDKVRQKLEKG